MPENNLRLVDAIIVVVFLFMNAMICLIIGRRLKSKESYLMASRNIHWFPVSLSSVAAAFSAISLLGAPGFVMAQDMRYLPTLFTGVISIPIVYYIVIPMLYKLRLVSVYEYLEGRFSPNMRIFASILFILTKVGYLSMIIFTPCLALSAMTGVKVEWLVLVFGLLTTVYTVVGGLEGIIWTELIQYFMIVIGTVSVILFFFFSSAAGHPDQYWAVASAAGKTKMWDFRFGIGNLSVWVLILNSTLMGIAGVCNDQTNIQRFFAAKSIKDSVKGYLFSLIFGTPIVIILYLIGAWMFGFFNVEQTLPEALAKKPDSIFPYFIAKYLPMGLSGIMLAVILGAGISTIGAVLHSLNSLSMVDFYERFAKIKATGDRYVFISRCVSFAWGIIGIFGAFYIMRLGNSIIEVAIIIGSLFSGPLGGIYFLGLFTTRANNFGAIVGGIAGLVLTIAAYLVNARGIMQINFMWYGVIGIVATFGIGYLVSLFFGRALVNAQHDDASAQCQASQSL